MSRDGGKRARRRSRARLPRVCSRSGCVCLIVSLIAMIRMEERPLRGPSEEVPPPA